MATHWLRLLPLPDTAGPSATRLEDFADLLTPFLVLGPLLVALAALRPGRRTWAAVLVGSVLFVQGHGLHLSANSVAWAQRGQGLQEPTHLWDEVVGHHLWFVGLTVVVWALVPVLAAVRLPAAPAVALSGLLALTWAANVVEGGAVPAGAALAAVLVVQGWRYRATPAGRQVAGTFALSLLLMAVWGLWQGGFPQPSELGWL